MVLCTTQMTLFACLATSPVFQSAGHMRVATEANSNTLDQIDIMAPSSQRQELCTLPVLA